MFSSDYDCYDADMLASGLPIHQSAVRQPDVYDFEEMGKWKSIQALPPTQALSSPMTEMTIDKPSYDLPVYNDTGAAKQEAEVDVASLLSRHTRSEWTPLAITHMKFPSLDAAKDAVEAFLSSLNCEKHSDQQAKCFHHLLSTPDEGQFEISIIYYDTIVVEFNLLRGCRTKFNSLFRRFRSFVQSSAPLANLHAVFQSTDTSNSDAAPPSLQCSMFGAHVMSDEQK